MTSLSDRETALIAGVLNRHPEISAVKLFGSRAKGTHSARSDVDLALWGVDDLRAEAVAAELDDLPLPYHFDVVPFDLIKQDSLREHIERVGMPLKTAP
jgi:predicted nucleotidyltransferase